MRLRPVLILALCGLTACTPPPAIVDSREVIWQNYAHQPIDKLLLDWGAPDAETKLSNGSRMIVYRHSTTYDAGSYQERTSGCELTVLAPPPKYTIEDVAMEGTARECSLLAQGRTGHVRYNYIPPTHPHSYGYPYRYGSYRF